MDLASHTGWVHTRSSQALRWHRRFAVLSGTKLEFYASENLEKLARDEKNEMIDAYPLQSALKAKAKARYTYKLSSQASISDERKTESFIKRGFSFKQVALCAFAINMPWHDKHTELEAEETEDGEGQKVMKLHFATEDESVLQRWKTMIEQAIHVAPSTVSVITDADEVSTGGKSVEDLDNISEGAPEPLMSMATLGRDQLCSLMHQPKYRYLGTYGDIEVMEEMENPRTYIMNAIVRSHPHTVFEEFQLLGTVPTNDAQTARFMTIDEFELIEREDNRDVYRIVFVTGGMTAPREVVLERYWRLDEDGTYVINFESIDHPSCPLPPHTGICGWNNVRLYCRGGITISPLKPEFESSHRSESLVTQVLNLTNAGGYLEFAVNSGLHSADASVVVPFAKNIAFVKRTVEAARFLNGNLTVVDRLQAAAAEKRAQDMGKRQQAMGQSLFAALAVAKFKKAIAAKRPQVKAVQMPINVDRSMWYDPGPVTFKVRGPDYLTNGLKIAASAPIFDFVALELFQCDQPVNEHIVSRPGHVLQTEAAEHGPYTFIVNLMIPGPPHLNAVVYFRCGHHEMLQSDTPFGRVWRKFLDGDDEERNGRFKLVPTIVEGSWMIKQAVGSTPVIMGKKLKTTYHKGNNYMEVDVDISCSKVACKVTNMCLGVTKSLVIDMAFMLEPHTEDELPECLLGVVRLKKIDLDNPVWLPGSAGAAAAGQVESKKDQ